jgi:hypothetical protein
VISYCVAAYRPAYASLLVQDLVRKTSCPFEILVWLNTDDAALERLLGDLAAQGHAVRIAGKSPENIGMRAYGELFRIARHRLIAQIDDDVIRVSPGIAERASRIFARHQGVRQLTADVWQDEFTTGARPPLAQYRCVDVADGLYDGPIDGWFSVYDRSILPLLVQLASREYCCIGGEAQIRLRAARLRGLLCTRMRVFHTIGPQYAALFGMLDFEVEKYRRLGRAEIVKWYDDARPTLPPRHVLEQRFAAAVRQVDATS